MVEFLGWHGPIHPRLIVVMSSPTVAILVRTKDRPRFLSRALENIAQQTFTDYTVCVINDGGDEQATRAVIEASPLGLLGSNAQDSSRVQLLTTAGGNMEAASNAGLAATTSEYVAIHDDDDLWAPEFLERTVAALEESGALMCTTRVVERYERENADGEFEVYEERIFHDGLPGMGLQFLFRPNRAVPIGILYRRSLHELVGFYDESLPVVGDWEFNMRAASVADILLVDEPLAYWSLRPDAEGAEANSVKRQADHARFDSLVRARAIREDLQAGAFEVFLQNVHNLLRGLLGDFFATFGAVRVADSRPGQTNVVVDFGDGADGWARVLGGGLLVDGDGRREAFDEVHVGLVHLAQERTGVGGQGLDVATLPFGEDRVEGEG